MTNYNLDNRCSLPAILANDNVPNELDKLHEQFKAGDRTALMIGVLLCANCKMIMPKWVADELGSLDNKLDTDLKLTLDKYFGFERNVSNHQSFKKLKQAQDNEREILTLLVNHRIDKEGLNDGTGSFSRDALKEIAKESGFSFGEIEVIYDKHKTLLNELNVDSPKKYKQTRNYDIKNFTFLIVWSHISTPYLKNK